MIGAVSSSSLARNFTVPVLLGAGSAAATGYWVVLPAIILLWVAWDELWPEGGPPVLALAFTYQWAQVFIGLFYYPLTGRTHPRFRADEPTAITALGLLCLISLLAGLVFGLRALNRPEQPNESRPQYFFSEGVALLLYFAFVAFANAISLVADDWVEFAQPLRAAVYMRFALLYLLLRRYSAERRWLAFTLIGVIEVLTGFTTYFATFREGFIVMLLAVLERFDWRRRTDWAVLGSLGLAMIAAGAVWTAVKGQVRAEIDASDPQASRLNRLARVREISFDRFDRVGDNLFVILDNLVDRQWAVYYPSLALRQVPEREPHSNGTFLWTAILHPLTPRIIFPEKPDLMSDSDKVRRYAGVWVAGAERNTSIAFGYAAESYVDFGVPVMFLPIFLFGLFLGAAYRLVNRWIWHEELAVAVSAIVFWMSLFLFERSWDRTIGLTLTYMIVMTGSCIVMERLGKTARPA
jgi:hypothetical protein